eukprot:162140-Hanusia_phi.AAC.2
MEGEWVNETSVHLQRDAEELRGQVLSHGQQMVQDWSAAEVRYESLEEEDEPISTNFIEWYMATDDHGDI